MAMIDAHGPVKAYGARRVLDDVSLAVAPGAIHGLLGPLVALSHAALLLVPAGDGAALREHARERTRRRHGSAVERGIRA